MEQPNRMLDSYGPDELAIPEWKLVQKVGGDWAKQLGAELGQFHNTVTDEIAEELNIIVVDIKMGRSKWGSEISDAGPVCATMDAKSNLSIYNDDCSQCPDRLDTPWNVDAAERRTKCCLNYTILGIDLDHDYLPVMVRAHGISALPARQLITQLKMNRALRGEYYKAVINIKSQAKDTRYGTAYAMHPKIVELITDKAKAEELRIESNRLLGTPIPLPVGRPEEEEMEPLGFMPDGTPFYSEEQKQQLIAEEKQKLLAEADIPKTQPPQIAERKEPVKAEKKKEPAKEEVKETTGKKPLDLDF